MDYFAGLDISLTLGVRTRVLEPKPGGQSLIRLRAFLNFASKRGVGAGTGVKLAGHDPLFLRLLINRALTKSPTAEMATMQPTTWRPDK